MKISAFVLSVMKQNVCRADRPLRWGMIIV
jgi:hypothetical protein